MIKQIDESTWTNITFPQYIIRIAETNDGDGLPAYIAHVFIKENGEEKLLGKSDAAAFRADAARYGDSIIAACEGMVEPEYVEDDQSYAMMLVRAKGFVNSRENLWQMLTLLHTEVSEAAQAYKRGEGDEKIREELADAFIRLLHTMDVVGGDLQKEFLKKMQANWRRPYKYNLGEEHGG